MATPLIVFAAALIPAGMYVGILMGVKAANGEKTPIDWLFDRFYDFVSKFEDKN